MNSSILPQKCTERVLSNLLMSPQTSPDDNSPVKPALSVETKEIIDESDSNIDVIKGVNSVSLTVHANQNSRKQEDIFNLSQSTSSVQ